MRHRFRVAPAGSRASRPLRFAYADPPYPGLARRYYNHREVNHRALIARLMKEFPHGWALSTSARALPRVLRLCPDEVRVAAWIRGSRPSVSMRARNAWEPVIVYRGRPRRLRVAEDLDDALLYRGRHRSHPRALVGMKPAAFAEWIFKMLGAARGDELVDIFPGSGAVTRAWKLYQRTTTDSALPSRCQEAHAQLRRVARRRPTRRSS